MASNINEEFIEKCQNNDLEGVTAYLRRGVDVNMVSEDGNWFGLYIAARWNYVKLLDILLGKMLKKVHSFSTNIPETTIDQKG